MLCVVEQGLLWKDRDVRGVLCANVCLILVLHCIGQLDTGRSEVDVGHLEVDIGRLEVDVGIGRSEVDSGLSKVPSPKTVLRVYSSGQ